MAGQVGWISVRIPADVLCSQSDSLVQGHVVADYSRLAYDYTSPVVNSKAFSYLGCGVDVYSG